MATFLTMKLQMYMFLSYNYKILLGIQQFLGAKKQLQIQIKTNITHVCKSHRSKNGQICATKFDISIFYNSYLKTQNRNFGDIK